MKVTYNGNDFRVRKLFESEEDTLFTLNNKLDYVRSLHSYEVEYNGILDWFEVKVKQTANFRAPITLFKHKDIAIVRDFVEGLIEFASLANGAPVSYN